jgi:hypothetical protein
MTPIPVPQVRKRLAELAVKHQIPELAVLSAGLYRRKPAAIAPSSSRSMTPELAAQILAYADQHPLMTQAEIGRHFDVNPGRVSEVLAGEHS